MEERENYKVKRMTLDAGQKLRLQYHRYKSKHWVILKGEPEITRGSEVALLHETESIYIPEWIHHRLENGQNKPIEIIEVRSGSYLREDSTACLEDI